MVDRPIRQLTRNDKQIPLGNYNELVRRANRPVAVAGVGWSSSLSESGLSFRNQELELVWFEVELFVTQPNQNHKWPTVVGRRLWWNQGSDDFTKRTSPANTETIHLRRVPSWNRFPWFAAARIEAFFDRTTGRWISDYEPSGNLVGVSDADFTTVGTMKFQYPTIGGFNDHTWPDGNVFTTQVTNTLGGTVKAGKRYVVTRDSTNQYIVQVADTDESEDKFVAVNQLDQPNYLQDQFWDWSTANASGLEWFANLETIDAAGDKFLRIYLKASDVYQYNAGDDGQVLKHTGELFYWGQDETGGLGGEDKYFRASATDTESGYWSEKVNRARVEHVQDFQVAWEINNTAAAEDIDLFVDVSATFTSFDLSQTQLYGHRPANAQAWSLPPSIALDQYDLIMRVQYNLSTMNWFIDASVLEGFSPADDRYLGMGGGAWKFFTPSGGGPDTDEKVKVSAGDTTGYLAAKLSQHGSPLFTSGHGFVRWETVNPGTANETVLGYFRPADLANYSPSDTTQTLKHTAFGTFTWAEDETGEGGTVDTDFRVKVQGSDASAVVLDVALMNTTNVAFNTFQDVPIFHQRVANAGNTELLSYWDASYIGGSSTSGELILQRGSDAQRTLSWIPKPSVGDDKFVKINASDTAAGYWVDKVFGNAARNATHDIRVRYELLPVSPSQVELFAPATQFSQFNSSLNQLFGHSPSGPQSWNLNAPSVQSGNDLQIWHEYTSGNTISHFIDASSISGFSVSGEKHLGMVNGAWQWRDPGAGTDTDQLVRVTGSDLTAVFLENAIDNTGTSPSNDTFQDVTIRFLKVTGTNAKLRGFWDASQIGGASTSGDLVLQRGGDANRSLSWVPKPTGGGAGEDKFFRVSVADSTSGYWADKVVGNLARDSVQDFVVGWESIAGANERVNQFVDASASFATYVAGSTQLYGHTAGGAQAFTATPIGSINTSEDMPVTWTLANPLRAFVDSSSLAGWSISGERHLATVGGLLQWVVPTSSGDLDERVKVRSTDVTAVTIEQAFQNVVFGTYSASQDVAIKTQLNASGSNNTAFPFWDASAIGGASASGDLVLQRTGDAARSLQWVAKPTGGGGTDTDEKVKGRSTNTTATDLFSLLQQKVPAAPANSTIVDIAYSGGDPTTFEWRVDWQRIGKSGSAPWQLELSGGGSVIWNSISTTEDTDEKVAVSATDIPDYLPGKFNRHIGQGSLAAGRAELATVTNPGGTKISPYIQTTDFSGQVSGVKQVLTKSTGNTFEWVTAETIFVPLEFRLNGLNFEMRGRFFHLMPASAFGAWQTILPGTTC